MTDAISIAKPEPAMPAGRLSDAWWPIAFSDQVRRHPKPFRLGWHRFAVYRDLSGVVRAVDDACPHRRLPLSMGRITEDGYLQCAYHGWCFDGETGQCTAIPNLRQDERVPRGMKVAVFATVEDLADAFGWGVRSPVLAPRVGPPTGEEPDEGTTMLPAAVVGRLVFVWTGARASPSGPLRGPTGVTTGNAGGAALSGQVMVRAAHDEVCDALLWNPGKLIGQGWLVGGGDEVVGPTVEVANFTLTVRRQRYALDPPRASTYGPVLKRVVTSATTMDAVTGLAWIDVSPSGRYPAAQVAVALTPTGRSRTTVRWSIGLDPAATPSRRYASAAAAQTARVRAASRAEAVVDAAEDAIDSAVDVLRRVRRTARHTEDVVNEEVSL